MRSLTTHAHSIEEVKETFICAYTIYIKVIFLNLTFSGILKDSARPSYWIPDDQITKCCVCETLFGPKLRIHHCRACGEGVCQDCSPSKRPIPIRGWDYPVRVCQKCFKKKDKV